MELKSDIRDTDSSSDLKGDVKIGDFGLASMRGAIKEGDDGTDDDNSVSAVSVSKNGDLTNGMSWSLHWQCVAHIGYRQASEPLCTSRLRS